jgi:thymidylate synthase
MIVSAWNPSALNQMALPPCHLLFQWYVSNGELSLQMYQRSGDSFLGIPFNIFSYSMLLVMMANVTNLKPGKFIHIVGDFHAYADHVGVIQQQIMRQPYQFPSIKIKRQVLDIDDFKMEDFDLQEYQSYPALRANMSV